MAIDSKNLLVWVKAMSRGKGLPLDASEVYSTYAEAETYAGSSAIAYPGQTIKAFVEADQKYHTYTLQPSESGYTLEEVGALKQSDLKQFVQVVETLPTSGQEAGVLYINGTDGYVYVGGESPWKKVFWDLTSDITGLDGRVDDLEGAIDTKAPIANPVFTGKVKVGTEELATQAYVNALINNLSQRTPVTLTYDWYMSITATAHEFDAGTTYRVAESGEYFGHKCEPGDLVIVLESFKFVEEEGVGDAFPLDTFKDSVMVIQANVDGAVSSTADVSTVGEIVVFDAVTGKVIKGSGVQIASLNDAIAKAHEHANATQLATYDKTQTELLAAAKSEAEGLVNSLSGTVDGKLAEKADKATTLAGYGITDVYTKTEIDGKVEVINGNLNSKISTTDAETKIATAKSETLEEAAAAAQDLIDAYDETMVETLSGKADKATTLSGYGITDAYTKGEADNLLAGKADKASSLAGYGIGDAYTKGEVDGALSGKADKATTLAGYGITDAYTKGETETKAGEIVEARVGAIPADTTVYAYVEAAKEGAIAAANQYTANALTVVEF